MSIAKPPEPATSRAVIIWLYACCGMIFMMALIGAITRLTESGLSITDWKPVTGALPPLNDAQWNAAFDSYKAIPQYQLINKGMSLEAFKHIFFWEWFHRLWGRFIGAVFFVPLVVFAARRMLSRALFWRLLGIFALGGLQGFIGWFMVQSGLETRTTVSPYRLALHLFFALLLYALLLWTASGLRNNVKHVINRRLRFWGWATLGLLATTIIWGAFVAGMRAGGAYNTWPLMDGNLFPPEAITLQPLWLNAVANTAAVQFMHRWLGPSTMIGILCWVTAGWKSASSEHKKTLRLLAGMALLQVGLGISTLLSHVDIVLAVTHQAGAITLLTLMLLALRGTAADPTPHR